MECLVGLLLATGGGFAGSASARAAAFDPPVLGDRVDDSDVSASARRRVRGGRPVAASIHFAWAPGARNPQAESDASLASFEREAFDGGERRNTIISSPPAAWMKQLQKPQMPVRWNAKTVHYLEYFRDDPKGQNMMRAWMRRAGRYEARLRRILGDAGVPEDLVMVALAESGFNPTVRSRVGAGGLWQFMAGTGKVYGLASDYWVDERYDIDKSTRAAALYLKDLKVRFGTWELALAAYNAGYGLVMTAIERHNTNSYWALCEIESGLPFATTNYVPKIIAAALVGRNRDVFGVAAGDVDPLSAATWVEVTVPQSTSLDKLASALDVDAQLMREYNAQLIRGRTPPKVDNFKVRIPPEAKQKFDAAAPALQKAWRAESTYEVEHGDSVERIALAFGTTPTKLRRMNGIEDEAELRRGVTLVVPREPTDEPPKPTDAVDDRVLAAVPALSVPGGYRKILFVTTRATTPREVERAFKVRWTDVIGWNDLDPLARIQADQVLQLLVPSAFDAKARGVVAHEVADVEFVVRGSAAHLEAGLRRRGKTRRGYVIRKGDDLEKIGRRFDLTVGDLARINGFGRRHPLEPGALIVVYVAREKTRGTKAPPPPRGTQAAPARPASTPTTSRVPGRRSPKPATKSKPKSKPTAKPKRSPSTPRTSRVPGSTK